MLLSRLTFVTYTEDDSFKCTGDPEPHIRYQTIKLCAQDSTWHIKVTLNLAHSNLLRSKPVTHRPVRRREFQSFIRSLRLQDLCLIENTVTEVELGPDPKGAADGFLRTICASEGDQVEGENRLQKIVDKLKWAIREDASRVFYPPFTNDSLWQSKSASDIKIEEDIAATVFRVEVDKELRIYKKIDRPFYHPRDSAALYQELQNLKLLRGDPNIVQLVAVVISPNPYQTRTSVNVPSVIQGILLDYHPGGTLERWLDNHNKAQFPWSRWPLQIGRGLLHLHENSITHMDLKPPNVVISADGNAILIDVSGSEGVTREWLAPECESEDDPLSLPLEARKLNDIWAYGKMISTIATRVNGQPGADLLYSVAIGFAQVRAEVRKSLADIVSALEDSDSRSNRFPKPVVCY
ncbi:MAG: hypothetical protein Q9179_006654 [Wetmoreana sp. 5 TL-2023]